VDYYWQRIIGYMEEPSFDITGAKVNISGSDYMKFLQDTELKSPDNYWGSSETFDSISSDGFTGTELYNEADAMDITSEADNVTNWTPTDCTFISFAEVGGGSTYVGKLTTPASGDCDVVNNNIFTPVAGTQYAFQFKYKRNSTGDWMNVKVYQGGFTLGILERLEEGSWTTATVYFTAQTTDVIRIMFYFEDLGSATEYYLDQFTIWSFIPYDERYYELAAACKGPYRVLLDSADVWEGQRDEGWLYEESTRRLAFDPNKTVAVGSSNLVIYYFTTTALEDAIADLLVTAGLYADRATAKADMDYTDPAIDIDQVWFDAGTSALNAVRKICERCDYRFYFRYDGKPVFKPVPTGATVFTFTDQKHVGSINRHADKNEIKNRVVITGKKQAEPTNREETIPSELRGEDSDATSITAYGERTLTIDNHLFQDQTPLDNMATSLLAEYKDPKWYADIPVPFNPVPLEMGDKISWKERIDPSTEITATGRTRDIKISKFNSTYICEKE